MGRLFVSLDLDHKFIEFLISLTEQTSSALEGVEVLLWDSFIQFIVLFWVVTMTTRSHNANSAMSQVPSQDKEHRHCVEGQPIVS